MSRMFSLVEAAVERLDEARDSRDGRSSMSLHEGEPCVLRLTVTGLVAGERLSLERPPHEGWILVVEGSITLHSKESDGSESACAGDLIQLPLEAHTVTANQDSALLLTVAMGERPLKEPAQ